MPNPTPRTIDEAATYMLELMEDSQKDQLREMEWEHLIWCHFGLGMSIRNTLNLPDPNHPIHGGALFFDADDCSMKILEVMWKRLQT